MMIFINYRREDSKDITGRLHDRLAEAFGPDHLFMDVDSIPPGVDFVSHLNANVATCDILLAVIGPNWLNLNDEAGGRRLDAKDDFVAVEITASLARDIPVIPILVDGTRMPKPNDLPEALKPLARRNAFTLRHESFGRDAAALIQKIRASRPARSIWKTAVIFGIALVSLGAISYFIWLVPPPSPEAYAAAGNFACYDKAEYPDSWRGEAPLCVSYGCNFGKMSRNACLALGLRKQSKTVIHGNVEASHANECWLQQACGDLRANTDFTMFRSKLAN